MRIQFLTHEMHSKRLGISVSIAALLVSFATLPASADPLRIAIEMHVENQFNPTGQTLMVQTISNAAASAGVPITFGFGRHFFGSYRFEVQHLIVNSVLNDGHAATLHADLPDGTFRQMLLTLQADTRKLERLGGNPQVASGVCNASGGGSGWLEAATLAGITTVAGVVQYCYLSLDPEGAYFLDYRRADRQDCPEPRSPASCHDAVPLHSPDRLEPWQSENTAEWLADTGSGPLIIPSFFDAPFLCLYESAQEPPVTDPQTCSTFQSIGDAANDAQAFVDVIVRALALREGDGGVFHITWSTNHLVGPAYINGFFPALQTAIIAAGLKQGPTGDIMFVTLPQI